MNVLPYITGLFGAYAHTIDGYFLAMGIIVSLVLGFTAGNYACSLVHRLPRGLGILDKKPYCGSCQTMLATKDLFPVFSALLLNHKCRYCSATIPKTHFYTELALGALFCLCFTKWGFSEPYILVALLGSMLTVLTSIHHNEGFVDKHVLAAVVITGFIYRVLADGSMYPALQAGLYGVIIAAIAWRKDIKRVGHIYVLPMSALIFIAGTIGAGVPGLIVYLLWFLVFYVLGVLMDSKTKDSLALSLALIITLFVTSYG